MMVLERQLSRIPEWQALSENAKQEVWANCIGPLMKTRRPMDAKGLLLLGTVGVMLYFGPLDIPYFMFACSVVYTLSCALVDVSFVNAARPEIVSYIEFLSPAAEPE